MSWIKELSWSIQWMIKKSSRSIKSTEFPNFETLDAKIASSLNKIIQNSYFKKKVSLEEQKAPKEDQFLRGRQIAYMTYDYFRVTGTHDTVFIGLCWIALCHSAWQQCAGIQYKMGWSSTIYVKDTIWWCSWKVCTNWGNVSLSMELYDMDTHQKTSVPNCQKLKTMVKRSTDQKLRLQNVDAGHGKIETGAVVKSWKGLSGVDRGRSICYEVETSREKEASEAKVSLAWLFDNLANTSWKVLARDRFVSIGILPNVNSTKQNRVVKQVISVCSRIMRLTNNHMKKAKKYHSRKGRGVATVNTVQLGCVSQDSESLESQRGAESLGNPRHEVLGPDEYDSHCLRNVKQVSEKIKDHCLEKYKSKFLISEVHTLWNLRTDRKKRLKDNSDAPETRHGILPKTCTSTKKKTKLQFPLTFGRMGAAGCINKRAGGKRVCGRFRSKCACGQQERPWLCRIGDHEDIVESGDGDDGQRRGANKRRIHGICQGIGFIRDSNASRRYNGSSLTCEALRGSWVFLPVDQRSKTTDE